MPEVIRERNPREIIQPNAELEPFTCEWAKDGLRKALEALGPSSTGVDSYTIGSRSLTYTSASEQTKVIDYWMRMVEYWCGAEPLPSSITGRDTACRIIPRDV
jgi:hypothetical protein